MDNNDEILEALNTDEEAIPSHEDVSMNILLQENLKKIDQEAKEFKDKYFRALADMENLRKRLQNEKQDLVAYAVDNVLTEILIPLDNLEKALSYTDQLSPELQNWALGFKMIKDQFKQALENQGIYVFDSLGKKFDPHFHEAIELVETTKCAPNFIIEEITKGYKRQDRVLRVAKVKVAKAIEESKESADKESFKGE